MRDYGFTGDIPNVMCRAATAGVWKPGKIVRGVNGVYKFRDETGSGGAVLCLWC